MRHLYLILFFSLSSSSLSYSEPWISTRYAQNCAGCHAPGRENLPAKDRRCSLSCQGCHVSPNGGGLRSFYGKWTEDRWLRSVWSKALKHERPVAPYSSQKYDVKGFPLLVEKRTAPKNEDAYRRSGNEFKFIKTREQPKRIPLADPYHLRTFTKIDGGGDIRHVVYQAGEGEVTDFLMSVDLGIRYRPYYKELTFVYETRFLGSPLAKDIDLLWGRERTRSAYVMLSDLPYNLYGMAGYYRPLFGYYTPDHTQISQKVMAMALTGSTRSQDLVYKSAGFGGSPNVPYFVVNLIDGRLYGNSDGTKDDTRGFALSVGLRGVTLGFSTSYSLWLSEDTNKGVKTTMHSVTGGMKLGPIIANMELLLANREDTIAIREGTVTTIDTQTKLFKENYFLLQYGLANTTPDLSVGETTQLQIGLRSFLFPGVDLSFVYDVLTVNGEAIPTYKWQTHLFF